MNDDEAFDAYFASNDGYGGHEPDFGIWKFYAKRDFLAGRKSVVPITREQLGKVIWDTSRHDEGTISVTGANIVADAVLTALTSEHAPTCPHGRPVGVPCPICAEEKTA